MNYKRLKKARKSVWITQVEMADYIKRDVRTVQYYECWEVTPPEEILKKMVEKINKPRFKWPFKEELIKPYTYNYFI
jgi:ribosome-binding protein aMBF1 (putative translation factor)